LKTVLAVSISSGTLPLPQGSRPSQWSRIMPRLWVESSFRIPVGVKIKDAWMRWHCGEHPLRAVTSKMLPEGEDRQRQCTLRRKFQGVFEIIQGQTSSSVVDMDVHHAWDVCWRSTVDRFSIPVPCNWVISTAYDYFLRFPQKIQEAKLATPCEGADVAVVAAARAARVAEETRAFAVAIHTAPLVRNSAAPEVAALSRDSLPVFGQDAARLVAEQIAAVAGPAALHPPALQDVLPANVLPAPALPVRRVPLARAAPPASPLLQQPPVGTEMNPHWPAPGNLWMLGTVMYITFIYASL
jgi:hypothetical protein